MRLALLSDIHANAHALDTCLAHARGQRADQFAFLGDMVGYGAEPGAVVQRIMELAQHEGALVLQGNHDAMALAPPAAVKTVGESTATWTHHQLSPTQRNWMSGLPLTQHLGQALLVHASVDEPEQWHYVYNQRSARSSLDAATAWPEVRYVFGGHVHMQTMYYRGAGSGLMAFNPEPGFAVPVPAHRYWLATVGSVGQPRDGDTRAMYCMFDTDRAELCFHRVAYDHLAAAAAIRRVGLPEFFASRLEVGR